MKHKPLDPRAPALLDKQIAKRILRFRQEKGVTQMELADRIGVTFQQCQKYERGTNRITASRLKLVADALDTPIASFFGE